MKRKSLEITKEVLTILKQQNGRSVSYGFLERKVNTNWHTIRDHIELLILFHKVKIVEGRVVMT